MKTSRAPRALCAATLCLPLSGCFTALTRLGGNDPGLGWTVGAAAADIATSPVQVPLLTAAIIDNAKNKPTPEQRARAAAAKAAEEAEQKRVVELAQGLVARLETEPSLLTSDDFWNSLAEEPRAASYARGWYLQKLTAPLSVETTRYLLNRFPDSAYSILHYGQPPHAELTATIEDRAQRHLVREAAIDRLLRDNTFKFGEPWITYVFTEFRQKGDLLVNSGRYTKPELEAILADPTNHPGYRELAKRNLDNGWFKRDPAPAAPP